MRRPLLHRVGLAPRIAVLVVLAMLVTHALQEVLEVLVPPPDFLVVEKEWLVQRTVDAAVAVGRARGEARAGALSALGADDALAFRIGGAPPPGTIQDVPVLRDAAAEIARRLALAPAHVVVRAEPFSEPEIAVGTPIVVLTRLPTWIRDVVNERIQEDAAITGSLVIAVRLDDGRWLSVTAKKTELARVRQLRIVAATGGGLLLIALLSIFAARLLIRPLGQLAKAAERLGRER